MQFRFRWRLRRHGLEFEASCGSNLESLAVQFRFRWRLGRHGSESKAYCGSNLESRAVQFRFKWRLWSSLCLGGTFGTTV